MDAGPSDSRQRLLDAFDAYLTDRQTGVSEKKPLAYTTRDKLWVIAFPVAVVLAWPYITLLLAATEQEKGRLDKLLEWALAIAAGVLGVSFESAPKLLPLSQTGPYKWAIGSVIAVGLLVWIPIVRVSPASLPDSAILEINTGTRPPSWQPLGYVTTRISESGRTRSVVLTPWDVVKRRFHVTDVMRLDYPFTFTCPLRQCLPGTLTARLEQGEFDREFMDQAWKAGMKVRGSNTLSFALDDGDARHISLLAGSYALQYRPDKCQDRSTPLEPSSAAVPRDAKYDIQVACP